MTVDRNQFNQMRKTILNANDHYYVGLQDCYIYLHHTDEYLWIPILPDNIKDDMASNFTSTNALGRTAPVFSYINSGPRTVSFQFMLHREMLDGVNIGNSNIDPEIGLDYVDALISRLQAIALPKYSPKDKSIEPPMISVKIGNTLFIKGVVTSGISVGYQKPILSDNKYALVTIGFTITEVDPYDANSVMELGSFRGLTRTLQGKIDRAIDNAKN